MTLTAKQLADFARYRVAGGTDIRQLGIEPYQIIKWEADAIERLMRRDLRLDTNTPRTLSQADKRRLRARAMVYVVPFNDVEVDSGVIDLTTLAESAGLIPESIPLYGSINHPDIPYPLIYADSEDELARKKSSMWGYYALRGNFILTRNTDGLLYSLGGEVSIWAAKRPTLTTIPPSRREALITTLVEFFSESTNVIRAETEAESK
jgi:hypothetical protein